MTPAVLGTATATGTGSTTGVQGVSSTTSGYGVWRFNSSSGTGVYGTSTSGIGVRAQNNSFLQPALFAENDGGGPAGSSGDMQLTGKITTYNNTAMVANGVPTIVSRVEFSSDGSGDGS